MSYSSSRIVPLRTLLGFVTLVVGLSFAATSIAARQTLADGAEASHFEVVAIVKSKPDVEDQLRAEALKLVAPSRKEPGNISYDLFQATDDKSVFAFHENWASMEAFTLHTKTPHFEHFIAVTKDWLDGPLKILHPISDPASR